VSAPVAPAEPDSAQIEAAYTAVVRQEIEHEKIYPTSREARIQHPEGRVGVWFVLGRDGAIADIGIDRSAGSILDRQAIVTVRRGRYAPFPPEAWRGEGQRRFTVELDFIPT
jgi:protein TonB